MCFPSLLILIFFKCVIDRALYTMCVYGGLRMLGLDGCLRWLPCRSVTVFYWPAVMVFATLHLTQLVVEPRRVSRNPSRLGRVAPPPFDTNFACVSVPDKQTKIDPYGFLDISFTRFKINVIYSFISYVRLKIITMYQIRRTFHMIVIDSYDSVLR